MGYRVCQLILCSWYNILIIDEWQSLQIILLGQTENSIVSNICWKKKNLDSIGFGSSEQLKNLYKVKLYEKLGPIVIYVSENNLNLKQLYLSS